MDKEIDRNTVTLEHALEDGEVLGLPLETGRGVADAALERLGGQCGALISLPRLLPAFTHPRKSIADKAEFQIAALLQHDLDASLGAPEWFEYALFSVSVLAAELCEDLDELCLGERGFEVKERDR